MSCHGTLPDPDANPAYRATFERLLCERFTSVYSTLLEETEALITDEQLDITGITRGSPLDLEESVLSQHDDISSHFFNVCSWAQEILDYESDFDQHRPVWHNLTRRNPALFEALDYATFRAAWFQARLLNLEDIPESIWEPVIRVAHRSRWDCTRDAIIESIGLELPRYVEYYDSVFPPKHEFKGTWAYFAEAAAERPHAVCIQLDSSSPDRDTFIRSEVLAAVKMTQYQYQRPKFAHHHTRPVLVCTFFRSLTARITQAHFDSKRSKLILRQSRILDLQGPDPSPDAWLMLRWMASRPVGLTQFPPTTTVPNVSSEDGASRPPQITTWG